MNFGLSSHVPLTVRRRSLTAEDAKDAEGITLKPFLARAVDDLRRDGLYALRLLRRTPLVAATAVVSLAIGIGANTAIFTVASAVLLRPPAGVADPHRLVDIGTVRGDGGFNPGSYPTYLDLRDRTTTLAGVYAHPMFPRPLSLTMSGGSIADASERAFGLFVTPNYFEVLGARASLGRLPGIADAGSPDAPTTLVLSHGFWTRRFNGDRAAIGEQVYLNGRPFTIAGVASEGFRGTGLVAPDLWLPLDSYGVVNSQVDAGMSDRASGWLVMGARLREGLSIAAATAEVEAIGRALAQEHPEAAQAAALRLLPSSPAAGDRNVVAAFILLLAFLVLVVLLVACANLTGILLARAAARRRETAVRLALGARRWQIVRQLLTETLILFGLGGAAGLFLARVLTSLVVAGLPSLPFPVSVSLALDIRVVVFTAGLSLLAALISGVAPSFQASKADLVSALKNEPGSWGRARLRQAFVVAQVALSILLVVSAGLFTRALTRAGAIDPGFDARGVELVPVDASTAGFADSTGRLFWRQLLDRVRTLPGVQAAALARVLPGGFEGIGLGGFGVPGQPPNWLRDFEPDWNIVEPGYFAALRIPIVAGRDFTPADSAGAPPVVIVGEAAARYFWPGQNAVGQYMEQRAAGPDGRPIGAARPVLVVGVARDIKSSRLIDGLSTGVIYLPLQQQYSRVMTSNMTIAVRAAAGRSVAEAIRAEVKSLHPDVTLGTPQTLEASVALGLVPQRVAASLAGILGLVGMLLAAIGIYGLTAFMVTRRMREFGVRLALGARPSDIVLMVVGHGAWLTAIGSAIGLTLAAGAAQLLSVFLFGVPPLDPLTFGGATVLFAIVGVLACYGPSRRATTADPVIALRHE